MLIGEDFGAEHVGDRSHITQKEVLLLLHGIRTRAAWQSEIQPALDRKGRIVKPLRYSYFDLFRFLIPLEVARRGPVNRFAASYRRVRQDHPDAEISILAHSFGTYIISRVLKREDCFDIRFKNVALCGSIIDENYKWELHSGRFDRIVNDYSHSDIWPLLASSLTWGYGASGRYGFGHPVVEDRRHFGFKHSDFLTRKFADDFWAPFFDRSDFVRPEAREVRSSLSDWFLTTFKLKYVLIATGILLAAFLFPGVCDRWLGYPACYDRSATAAAADFLGLLDRKDYSRAYDTTFAVPAKLAVTVPQFQKMTETMRNSLEFGTRSLYRAVRQGASFYHVVYETSATNEKSEKLLVYEYMRLLREGDNWRIANYLANPGSAPANHY